jgi:hypothetical protein
MHNLSGETPFYFARRPPAFNFIIVQVARYLRGILLPIAFSRGDRKNKRWNPAMLNHSIEY